jgi:hypothetical protein
MALPTAASAGCYGCYTPPPQPCTTCYQRQVVPPQYRAVQETVMVTPGGVVAHRTPAQYRTVMVPQTVMVAPEGVQYEQIPALYATRARIVRGDAAALQLPRLRTSRRLSACEEAAIPLATRVRAHAARLSHEA